MKNIFILGSTGSIGVNTLNVISQFPDKFRVVGLTANKNVDLLKKQIEKFSPTVVVVADENSALELRKSSSQKCEILSGNHNLVNAAKSADYDILVSALVGFAGLAPTIEGIKRKKRIALANKETLVVAGELINQLINKYSAEIIPVDSEHSAIFQCLTGESVEYIDKIILTASGGPFRKFNLEDLKSVTVKEALKHPNWEMGNKITIDSATMMNKGLEVIEAHWLFKLPKEKLEVVIHPQSVIHSMVQFIDGSIKAQLSLPDMRLPIQYALSYPERFKSSFVNTELPKVENLSFHKPDFNKFECLKLAYDAMKHGGTAPCILNAANEIAVSRFLNSEIGFLDIPNVIKHSLEKIENNSQPDLDAIYNCDRKARDAAKSYMN